MANCPSLLLRAVAAATTSLPPLLRKNSLPRLQAFTSGEAQVVYNDGAESVSSSSCAAGKKRTLEELTWDHSFICELLGVSLTGDSVRQVWLEKRFLGAVHTSEWFNTADCSIKTGLIATVIVS